MFIHVWTVSFSYVYLFMKGKTYTPHFEPIMLGLGPYTSIERTPHGSQGRSSF